jgi:integrase
MSKFLYGLFEGLKTRRINDYVFPGVGSTGHLVETVKQMKVVEHGTQLALNGLSAEELKVKLAEDPDNVLPGIKFCLHDLRRTFITIAESLDIPYAALKRLLNHSDGNDVTGGYLQITTDRLREPMERISTKLMELMGVEQELPPAVETAT